MINFYVKISFVEIYLERVRDLMIEQERFKAIENPKIMQDKDKGLWVMGCTEVPIETTEEAMEHIDFAMRNRATAHTKMNMNSSRSHALLIVLLEKFDRSKGIRSFSQLYLVDLAGSERVTKSEVTSVNLLEAGSINRSLLTLGNVIEALVEKKSYIPFRDSKLTRLLSNSFGGNS